jgi:hypothetical protein
MAAKKKSSDRFRGTWTLIAPSGTHYDGHLQWKRFYPSVKEIGPNAERYGLFKLLPIKRKKS